MSKKQIYLGLIRDIHRICEENDITYFLHGKPAINAYLNGTIEDEENVMEVAMTQGDAERFQEYVLKEIEEGQLTNRYVESTTTNPRFKKNFIMFGDTSTVCVDNREWNVTKSTHMLHNGIHINIRYIAKQLAVEENRPAPKKKSLLRRVVGKRWERRFKKIEDMEFTSWNLWYVRIVAKILHLGLRLRYGKNYRLRKHEARKDYRFIDRWEHIAEYEEVCIGIHTFPSELFRNIKTVAVDSNKVNVLADFESYATLIYGEEWQEKNETESHVFTNAYMSYEEFSNNPEIQKQIRLIKANRERLFDIRKNAFFLRKKIVRVKKVVVMSRDKVALTEQYLAQKEQIKGLSFEKDYEELKTIFMPLMCSIRYWARRRITYSIEPEIDDMLYKIMLQEGYVKTVEKIKRLKQTQYFV